MGYTHYFRQTGNEPSKEEWFKIIKQVKDVFKENEAIICYECDEPDSLPLADEGMIRFNGKSENGHETFLLFKNTQGFNFCKTRRKPYDKVVVDVLKIVKKECPDWLELGSDGGEDIFEL